MRDVPRASDRHEVKGTDTEDEWIDAWKAASTIDRKMTPRPRAAPVRILIHAINYAPEFIGCGKYTTELAEFLAARGHEIEVVTAPPHYPGWYVRAPYSGLRYARETLNGVRVTRCPMLMKRDGGGMWRILAPLTFAVTAAPALAWRTFRFRPNVVFCVEPTLFAAPAAMACGKLAGARTVLHVQDLEVDAAFGVGHVKSGLLKRLALKGERTLLRAYDQIITISGQMRQALVRKGIAPARVGLARNWIDLERIHVRTREEGAAYRRELKIAHETIVALYAGHVGPKQALAIVAKAARLMRDDPDFVLVIAGEGPSLKGLIETHRNLPNLRLLPLQPARRLNELLGFADIHVLPQLAGAADLMLPSKLGGMLASGRPIVAMAEAGTELATMLAGAAVLTACGDAQALADGLRAARTGDTPDMAGRRRALASELDMEHVLPAFEAMILGVQQEREANALAPCAAPQT